MAKELFSLRGDTYEEIIANEYVNLHCKSNS